MSEPRKPTKYIKTPCGQCGAEIALPPSIHEERIQRSKSGKLFCSHTCLGKTLSEIRNAKK